MYGRSKRTHPLYWIWVAMIQRCYSETHRAYRLYGARGIRVCERWRVGTDELTPVESFAQDMGERPSPSHSLDRIDNDGDYKPGNCRWATPLEQSRNNRNCRQVTLNGKTQSVTEWAAELHISRSTVYKRLDAGHTPEEALLSARVATKRSNLSEVKQRRLRQLRATGNYTYKELATQFGITPQSAAYHCRKPDRR